MERYLQFIITFVMLTHCSTHPDNEPQPDIPPTITVWIHGTFFLSGKYHRALFHSTPSLKSVNKLQTNSFLTAICQMFIDSDPQDFSKEHTYVFGWSGKLNVRERQRMAPILLRDLLSLQQDCRDQYKIDPRIRIIAHSHGASVALTMAQEVNTPEAPPIVIDELIMLACPVQEQIITYAHSHMFKRIFSLYSNLDFVQIIAPEILRPRQPRRSRLARLKWYPFSRRLFPPQKNLIQAQVKINGRAISHNDFIKKPFLSSLAQTRNTLIMWLEEQNNDEEWHTNERLITINT